ncbi:hypothetical protein OG21DRAFT_1527496 [Imleria badia]|nr:hypothetical protein OG21DRAFT_1527496 [Imleria badia]
MASIGLWESWVPGVLGALPASTSGKKPEPDGEPGYLHGQWEWVEKRERTCHGRGQHHIVIVMVVMVGEDEGKGEGTLTALSHRYHRDGLINNQQVTTWVDWLGFSSKMGGDWVYMGKAYEGVVDEEYTGLC